MGSEFSYEDIANSSWEKFTYENNLSQDLYDGIPCLKGTRYPKDKNSGYTKQITWIDKKTNLVKKIDYYDRKKSLLKTAIFSNWQKIKNTHMIGKIYMTNHQNNKQTILIWKNIKTEAKLSKKDFLKRKLSR